MKIAITDACIFIDICDLQLITPFFKLELEVHTSLDVINELFGHQRELLMAFQRAGQLIVHNISEEDRITIIREKYPNGLSGIDKTVLFLAAQLNAIILSSDKTVRHNAKIRGIEYHGMLWIFDQLIEASLITCQEASAKLKTLIMSNVIYQNNMVLLNEMNNRLKKWDKHLLQQHQSVV